MNKIYKRTNYTGVFFLYFIIDTKLEINGDLNLLLFNCIGGVVNHFATLYLFSLQSRKTKRSMIHNFNKFFSSHSGNQHNR